MAFCLQEAWVALSMQSNMTVTGTPACCHERGLLDSVDVWALREQEHVKSKKDPTEQVLGPGTESVLYHSGVKIDTLNART